MAGGKGRRSGGHRGTALEGGGEVEEEGRGEEEDAAWESGGNSDSYEDAPLLTACTGEG